MRKRLLIINPVQQVEQPDLWNESALSIMKYPPTNLAYLAALTPPSWEIRVIDETQENPAFEDADLVAITTMTPTAPRAYAISDEYRRRGAKTVMGGIHASMLPSEAMRFVDTVVVGEADSVWPELIRDFEKNGLKRLYTGEHASLENLAMPRRDLLRHKYALGLASMETARGCPNDCEFCSVTAFNGRRLRERPVRDVLDELAATPEKHIFFTDNTIMVPGVRGEKRAIDLFKGMVDRGLKKRWFSQAGIDIAFSPEVLKWAKRSGCSGLGIGFESVRTEALEAMRKTRNLRVGVGRYSEGIKRIHHSGIAVAGAFVLGSDGDTRDVFERTVQFVLNTSVDASQFTVLTPLPGTRLFNNLREQGRLFRTDFPADWTHYDFLEVVFRPRHMTPDQLMEGIAQTYRETSSRATSLKRAFTTLVSSKSVVGTGIAYAWNRGSGELFERRFEPTRETLPPEVRYRSHLEPAAPEEAFEEFPSHALKM